MKPKQPMLRLHQSETKGTRRMTSIFKNTEKTTTSFRISWISSRSLSGKSPFSQQRWDIAIVLSMAPRGTAHFPFQIQPGLGSPRGTNAGNAARPRLIHNAPSSEHSHPFEVLHQDGIILTTTHTYHCFLRSTNSGSMKLNYLYTCAKSKKC